LQPLSQLAPRLLSPTGRLLLADPPLRAKHNRERFLELVAESGLRPEEAGERQARVWEEAKSAYQEVPIAMLLMKKAYMGETIGVKL